MLSLPNPRSSKATTSAPLLLTLDVAEWNFGASAEALLVHKTSVATATASAPKNFLLLRMMIPPYGHLAWPAHRSFASPDPLTPSADADMISPGISQVK